MTLYVSLRATGPSHRSAAGASQLSTPPTQKFCGKKKKEKKFAKVSRKNFCRVVTVTGEVGFYISVLFSAQGLELWL